LNLAGGSNRRRGIAGVLVMVIIFALLFTAGTGYLFYQARANLSSYSGNVQALEQRALISQEQLAFKVSLSLTSQPVITVNDTGGFPISVVGILAKDITGKVIWGPFTLGGLQTSATGPLNLNVGQTGSFTCISVSCVYTSGIIYVGLLTSRGNVFVQQYPLLATTMVTTISSATTSSLTGPASGGGNSLVVTMAATPIQVFSGPCPGAQCITDNVTLYNYSPQPMTGAGLHPNPPWSNVTGTATVRNPTCSGPYTPPGQVADPTGTISGYSGTGPAPHIFFLCTYAPQTGSVGGLASFSGWAYATQGTTVVESASTESNIVQIGGLSNVIAQGVFSTNFFFFKYTSCTNAPSGAHGSYSYTTACTTNTAVPASSPTLLPEGAVVSGSATYYLAFYLQVTNNFNTSIPILASTFLQVDPSAGGETDYWIVGTNTTMQNGAYYPNYAPTASPKLPTLTAYPTDCATVNAKNIPTDTKCIYVDPGQTVTLTLAACGQSATNWDWGGEQYGAWDSNTGCDTGGSQPGIATTGSANEAETVISYEYKSMVLTEVITFNGVVFTA